MKSPRRFFLLLNVILLELSRGAEPVASGWGIDACISIFAQPAERPIYLENLRAANVSWLRERGPVPAWAEVKAGGVNVVGFTSFGLKPQQKGNQLPEDLLAVFHAAEAMQRKHGAYVDAWEMVGEPDVGYCPDLPDRLAAYQKAVYLGIKRGAFVPNERPEGGDLRPEVRTAEAAKPVQIPEGGRSQEAEMASQQRWPKGPTEPGAPRAGEGADLRPEGGPKATVDGSAKLTVDGRSVDGGSKTTVDDGRLTVENGGLSTGYRLPSRKRAAQTDTSPGSSFQVSGFTPQVSVPKEPLVLMGALALPPGPWLERATRNGLLDYTDAYNFHFYGHAKDLTSVIEAHAAFLRRVDAAKQKPEGGDLKPERGDGDFLQTRGPRPTDPSWGIGFGPTPWTADVAAGVSTRTKEDETTKRLRVRLREGTAPSSVSGGATNALGSTRSTSESRPARRSGPTSQVSGLNLQVSTSGSSPLPLWLTEAGLNAVDPDDFLNPARRQLQADFTVSTARQALAHPEVAMFMPFILVHKGDGHALTVAADKPLPAWDTYAAFTRANPWPQRPLARVPENPNPIVVQWLPDNKTTVPHKVSGTYRFWGKAPIVGEIRVYNFSEAKRTLRSYGLGETAEPSVRGEGSLELEAGRLELGGVRGQLRLASAKHVRVEGTGEPTQASAVTSYGLGVRGKAAGTPPVNSYGLEVRGEIEPQNKKHLTLNSGAAPDPNPEPMLIVVPPMSMLSIPITITAVTPGYFREYLTFEFVDDTGRVSPLYFGVERAPVAADFEAEPLQLADAAAVKGYGLGGTAKPSVTDYALRVHGGIDETPSFQPLALNSRAARDPNGEAWLRTPNRADSVRPIRFPLQDDYTVTSTSGPWVGINGLIVEKQKPEGGDLRPEGSDPVAARASTRSGKSVDGGPSATVDRPQSTGSRSTVHRADSGAAPVRTRLRAFTPLVENDPLRQTLAVARIAGLPPKGFLYLKTNRPMNADFYVRVDLLDRQGQRFAIWENMGVSYYGPQNEAWLNLEDFQHYIWTGVTTNPRLDPTQVEEIQLRFYFKKANDPVEVEMEIRQPRRLPVRS